MSCCKGTEVCEEKVCPYTGNPVAVTPCGTQVLVAKLSDQEILNSKIIHVDSVKDAGPPQGVILAVGPRVPEDYGFKVGDRVLVNGNYFPSIPYKNRDTMLIEPHQVKGVVSLE